MNSSYKVDELGWQERGIYRYTDYNKKANQMNAQETPHTIPITYDNSTPLLICRSLWVDTSQAGHSVCTYNDVGYAAVAELVGQG